MFCASFPVKVFFGVFLGSRKKLLTAKVAKKSREDRKETPAAN
jgi:hypothetical protein